MGEQLDVLVETTEYDIDFAEEGDENESLIEDSNNEEDFFLSGLNVKDETSSVKKRNNKMNDMNVSNYSLHHIV